MYRYLTFLGLLLLIQNCLSQEFTIPDSLTNRSYLGLQNNIYSSLEKNSINKANLYAKTYLSKAINEGDSLYIAEGYLYLSSTVNDLELQNIYLDKSINYSKNLNGWLVPCMAYSIKGGLHDDKREYKKSLDFYLLAHEAAKKGGNINLMYLMKSNIGLYKSQIRDFTGALEYTRDVWNHIKQLDSTPYYYSVIYDLSYIHSHLKNIDSAKFYNQLGFIKSKETKTDYYENEFIFLNGVNNFFNSSYEKAIPYFKRSLNQFNKENDTLNIVSSYYFLGASYDKLTKREEAMRYFMKMDSILIKTDILIPFCRKGYKYLIDYHKINKNSEKELFYTNRLLRMDSVINVNYKILSKTIYDEFETPILLKNRDILINKLKEKDKTNISYIYILSIIIFSISIGLIYNYFKRKRDNLKFQELLNQVQSPKKNNEVISKESIDLGEELVNTILKKLKQFEEKEKFLSPNISLVYTSKKLRTNSRYLSKVVNYFHQKTFTNYINDLRIDYVIHKLKMDESFRKYSIDAIGKEIGFKTGRAFSNVFKKKTGLYPSYFINELNKSIE
ncbi:helix-turn-helix domain-containing protein [Kordia sp.]|uniref:helix-turn-helix domain-containing protein n=1 Tax=Kordia sp. TaxID=1965332 RepID=UPI003D277B34